MKILSAKRLELLKGIPAFTGIPLSVMEELANAFQEEEFPSGRQVIQEGEAGDRLYLVAEGDAEIQISTEKGPVVVATLSRGEIFGEIALLIPHSKRTSTVCAASHLLTLTLKADTFETFLGNFPETRQILKAAAERMLVVNFLKKSSPFAILNTIRLNQLASRLKRLNIPSGALIIRQGEKGEACYLIRSGSVKVLVKEGEAPEHELATLGPGTFFGEAALLTTGPRNASVEALETCELLELSRTDLLEVVGKEPGVHAQMCELLNLRDRPRQIKGLMVQKRMSTAGTEMTILKDPGRGVYFQLSPQGWFIWQQLNGKNTLRDMTLEYFKTFGEFGPYMIAEVIAGLASVGFVEGTSRHAWLLSFDAPRSFWQKLVNRARRILQKRIVLRNVDQYIAWLYGHGIRWLYTRPGMIALASLGIAGFIAFLITIPRAVSWFGSHGSKGLLFFWLIPLVFIAIILHEVAHAFTVKAFGRQVFGIGAGWYWFCPIAFVDTSDMWLADRWPRIAVSLAGICANALLAGAVMLAGWFSKDIAIASFCWLFSLGSYLIVLFNCNPLLEYDGYYVLMDVLARPNLRSQCLRWLGREFPKSWKSFSSLRSHWLELIYGLASLAYVGMLVMVVAVLYRNFLQQWAGRFLPQALADGLGWLLVCVVGFMSVMSVYGELRG